MKKVAKPDKLKKMQDGIFKQINRLKDELSKMETADEYLYILLWQPAEWIMDYFAYEDYLKDKNPGKKSESEFWEEWKRKGVDKKVKYIKQIVPEIFWPLDELRHYRNYTIQRYNLRVNYELFGYLDTVCKAFYKQVGKKSHNNKKFSDYKITISLSNLYDENMEPICEGDREAFLDIMDYMAGKPNKVILYAKIETLAQRYARKMLDDRGYKVSYDHAIFVNDIRIENTCIDYFLEQLESLKPERETRNALKTVRDQRNLVLHNYDVDNDNLRMTMQLWLILMRDYFDGAFDDVVKIIESKLDSRANRDLLILRLKEYSEASDQYCYEGNRVALTKSFLKALSIVKCSEEIKNKYEEELAAAEGAADDAAGLAITEKIIAEFLKQSESLFKQQSAREKKEYGNRLKECLGEGADSLDENTKYYLESALFMYDLLDERKDEIDCAGACIELTRALETFLHGRVFTDYYNYLKVNELVFSSKKADKTADEVFQEDMITLGTYTTFLFGLIPKPNERVKQTSGYFRDFSKDKPLYITAEPEAMEKIINRENEIIEKIKKEYRDRSAHRDKINKERMNDCLRDVLTGENSAFKQLLKDLK